MKNIKNANVNCHFRAIKEAFPKTLPVMAGYLFLGASYGVLMASRGFSFLFPALTSLLVFAGSMEFTLANLLVGAFSPVEALLMALVINARHVFYGISMLDKYRDMGAFKPYLIFSLTDETFSVNYTAKIPEGVSRRHFYFYTSILNHLYWVTGATLGGLLGSLIPLGTEGFDFAMTAMFSVILLEQLLSGSKNILSAFLGVGVSLLSLLVFGADTFLIPAMLGIFGALTLLRRPIERLTARSEEGLEK